MCAAVSAAREGANVALIDDKKYWAEEFQEMSGILWSKFAIPITFIEERVAYWMIYYVFFFWRMWRGLIRVQARAFKKWVLSEKRIKLFLNARAFDCEMNESGDKVSSLLAISGFEDRTHSIFGQYFIDCSGVAFFTLFR